MRLLLVACALTAAPRPGSADDERADASPRVDALHLEGVHAIEPGALKAKLLTQGPRWWGLRFWEPDPPFDPDDLQEDLIRISEIYREYGYFEAKARSELAWDDHHRKVDVTIRVDEGEPVRLTALEVHLTPGAPLDSQTLDELVAKLPVERGDVFGSRAYAEARQALLDALAERGRPGASIQGGAHVDVPRREARVEWTLDPGPLVRFGEVRLTGLEDVDPELVRRELTVAPGQPYTLSAQRESERRLRDTELFHAIAVQPERPPEAESDRNGEETWPLVVRLRERPPRSLRAAVGYGTEEQARARLSWRHRNFLGGARKLELRAEYSSLLSGGEVRFLQPHFLEPKLDLGVNGSIAYEDVPAFTALHEIGRLQLTRPLMGPWKLRTGYEFEYADVIEVSADEPEQEEVSRVSALFAGLRRDTLDDRLSPTRGTWLDLYAEPALEAIGSSASYTTLVAETRAFHQQWGLVFGGRLRAGSIEPMGGSGVDDVPIYQRFFSGGSTSVRGYDYQSLGPRDDDNDPLGGLTLTEASVEVRLPLPWWRLSLVGFVDAGQISSRPWSFRGRDVQFGAGPGLRLGTPVGPLRFDLGFPLNPRPDDASFRIHFAVGQAF